MAHQQTPIIRVKHAWGFFAGRAFRAAKAARKEREISQRIRRADYRRKSSLTYNRRQALMNEPD